VPGTLRATLASNRRAPPDLIAPVMGHVDSRMVERVYGRLTTEDPAARIAISVGARCDVGLLDAVDAGAPDGLVGQSDAPKSAEIQAIAASEARSEAKPSVEAAGEFTSPMTAFGMQAERAARRSRA
jgi:hypothetical protein